MKTESTPRIYILFFALCFFALVLIVRLFFIQIVHGAEYADLADEQYVNPSANIFDRGSIFFKEKGGELVSAATLKTGYLVAINPQKITNAEAVYEKISAIIEIDRDDFFQKAAKSDDPYEEIARRVDKEHAYAIYDLDVPGVTIEKHRWRFYPAGDMAAQTLGFVSYKGDDLIGRYGLEHYYEDVLSRANSDLYVNFFAEIFSNITDSIIKSDNSGEGDVVTTIEPHVQNQLETVLSGVMSEWNSRSVGGIIINPMTGSIYALAAAPSFDPNDYGEVSDTSLYLNPLIEKVYEMGSIVKPIAMAAALDTSAVTADTTYNDKGYIVLNGARIENYDGRGRGVVDMQEVLNQSLNTGMVFVEQQMGHDDFRKYMLSYGLGEETGIDLPGEVAGLVSNLQSTRDVEYATAAFGQGVAMTPISIARSLAVLGNGGKLITPYVVDKIDYRVKPDRKIYPDEGLSVLKKETSEEITRMLVEVVDTALLNGEVAMPHYSIAAKTGTAQIADKENGGYYTDRYLHSFFGYFPAYNPQFLIFLYNVEPQGARYASQTLTHPFIDLVKFLIHYYEVEPDR